MYTIKYAVKNEFFVLVFSIVLSIIFYITVMVLTDNELFHGVRKEIKRKFK
jgi:uncharacterized membrane protein (DUF106 family)